jgi:hypothetical protein
MEKAAGRIYDVSIHIVRIAKLISNMHAKQLSAD